MKQVVYTFSGKKYTKSFVTVKSDVVFSSIIITNILKMVKSTRLMLGPNISGLKTIDD